MLVDGLFISGKVGRLHYKSLLETLRITCCYIMSSQTNVQYCVI